MNNYVVSIKFEAENDDQATLLAQHLSKEAVEYQEDGVVSNCQIAVVKLEDKPVDGE